MRLHLMAVLSIIGYSYLSQAAECYFQDGGANCVNGAQLLDFGAAWCAVNFNVLNSNWWGFVDAAGNAALIGKIGNFQNPLQCTNAFDDIVNTCFGQRNGGSWTSAGVSLNINFCQWPTIVPFLQAQDCSL